jgi:hypothetical protein
MKGIIINDTLEIKDNEFIKFMNDIVSSVDNIMLTELAKDESKLLSLHPSRLIALIGGNILSNIFMNSVNMDLPFLKREQLITDLLAEVSDFCHTILSSYETMHASTTNAH